MTGKYRSVSTAEKREEYKAAGEPWPVCGSEDKCNGHGVEKQWEPDPRRYPGGYWRCRATKWEKLRRNYVRNSDTRRQSARDNYTQNPEHLRESARRYRATFEGVLTQGRRRRKLRAKRLEERKQRRMMEDDI